MLDDLDWELERRGLRFVRYADDGRIYARSRRAGERVMDSITRYIEQRLKLRVNREKSVVDRATRRPFSGSGSSSVAVRSRCGSTRRPASGPRIGCANPRPVLGACRWSGGSTRSTASPSGGQPTSGWLTPPRSSRSSTNGCAAACGRCAGRNGSAGQPRRRNLIALGTPPDKAREWAGSRKGPWRIAGSAPLQRTLTNGYWTSHGLRGFTDPYRDSRDATRTARCGPARRVGVGGAGVSPAPVAAAPSAL